MYTVLLISMIIFFMVLAVFIIGTAVKKNDKIFKQIDKKKNKYSMIYPAGLWIYDQIVAPVFSFFDKSLMFGTLANRRRKFEDGIAEVYGMRAAKTELRRFYAKTIGIILFVTLLITFISSILGFQALTQDYIDTGSIFERPEFGGESQEHMLQVEISAGDEVSERAVNLKLGEMPPNEEQKRAILESLAESLPEAILEDNASIDQIVSSLNLITLDEETGTDIEWDIEPSGYITLNGRVNSSIFDEVDEDSIDVKLTATLTLGEQIKTKEINATLVNPVTLMNDTDLIRYVSGKLDKWISEVGENYNNDIPKKVLLPGKLPDDVKADIVWSAPKNTDAITLLVLGLILVILIAYLQAKSIKKAIDKRQFMLRTDYPDFVNKICLMLEAGMVMRNAWDQVIQDYIEQQKRMRKPAPRPLYEEMILTAESIKEQNLSEAQAFRDFALRCKTPEIMKFITALLQNLRTGGSQLKEVLRLQAMEAWETRKSMAREQSEKASSKLLLPMMLMFIAILIVILYPAVIGMNF